MPAKSKSQPEIPGPFGSKQTALLEHDRELVAGRFSPCGTFLFAGSYDANVYRWDLATLTKTALPGHQGWIQGLVFHPDGKRMFTGDSWGGLRAWTYADESPQPLWTRANAHARWMRALAISSDGSLVATCGADRMVRLWSSADGALKWESPLLENDPQSLCFHPTEDVLIVGDLKGVITQWDLITHAPTRRLDAKILYLRPTVNGSPDINEVGGVRCMAFDPAGQTLACCGSEPTSSGFFTGKPTVVLFDWKTAQRSGVLQWDHVDPSEGITLDVAWHPDGSLVAASSGQPGKGALYGWKPGEKTPFYLEKKFAHGRSVSLDTRPHRTRLALTQVRPASGEGGNGRRLSKDGGYLGFAGQIRIFESAES